MPTRVEPGYRNHIDWAQGNRQHNALFVRLQIAICLPPYSLLLACVPTADRVTDFIDACNAAWLLAQDVQVAYTFDRRHFFRLDGIRVRVPGEA